ncbi:ABC transporter ATP-binding protein [Puia sp.]|uniref:ABC transporter ATP-binding protein n=1 Tax=Puia sp. TaxID=2045100 RepID=UPI002F40BD98
MKIIRKIYAVLTAAERRRLNGLMLLDILTSIADIAFLALLLFVIHLYADDASSTKLRFLPAWFTDRSSLWPIAAFFGIFTIKNALSFWIYTAQARFRYDVASRISHRNLLLYLEGDYTQYAHTDSAKHVLKIAQQPIEFCQFILNGYQQGMTEGTLIVMTIVAVLLFNAKLFLLLLLLLLPPMIITAWLTKRKLHAARTFIKSSRDIMWQHLQESIASYVESGLFNRKEFFANRYGDAQTILNRHLATVQSIQGAPSRLAEVFAVFGLLALIAIGHFSGTSHAAGFVTLGAFLAAAYKVIPGVARLLNITGQMKTYEFTVNGLLADKDKTHKPEPTTVEPIRSVACRQIAFQYGDHKILDDINLQVNPGDFLGIYGDSGKGKTTLLNILLGFITQDRGEVVINGSPASPAQRQGHWPRIAYVKQQPFILHDTILVNITLDENNYDEERLQAAVTVTGLDTVIDKLPGGLHARITENGKNISGGQRQRIALARALYKEADLILLDEPFSELDEASEEILLSRFARLAEAGRMIVMITHNKQSLSWCNVTLSLDEQSQVSQNEEISWKYASNKK